MDYKLSLSINATDLEKLRERNLNIVLGKSISNEIPRIAWSSFNPFEHNDIRWKDEIGIYAALNTSLEVGSVVNVVSDLKKAEPGKTYIFEETGVFKMTDQPVEPYSYEIDNQMPANQNPALTFGLMQDVTIQGINKELSVINALAVPANQHVRFLDATKHIIYIWLLENTASSAVIDADPEKATVLAFTDFTDSHDISLHFDMKTMKFIP
ncbi:MAG: hypothetical protein AAFQ94_25110 [Bacteroidota bacterium]